MIIFNVHPPPPPPPPSLRAVGGVARIDEKVWGTGT